MTKIMFSDGSTADVDADTKVYFGAEARGDVPARKFRETFHATTIGRMGPCFAGESYFLKQGEVYRPFRVLGPA